MKKVFMICILVILTICLLASLISCGKKFNGVEYDYDGIAELKKAIDNNDALTNKKAFLKEYVIVKDPWNQTFIEFKSNVTMTIKDADGNTLPAGTYSEPILIEIIADATLLNKRVIIAKIISE